MVITKNSGKTNYGVQILMFDTIGEYTTFIATPEADSILPGSIFLVPASSQAFRKLSDGTYVADASGGEGL